MTWMLTHTGAKVDLQRPDPASISTLDIAHSLSLLNRFTGHTCRPYSVAEHSLLVAEILQREFAPVPTHAVLAALVHDAHEAYLGDISTPLKQALGPWAIENVERALWLAVQHHFGTHSASRDYASLIKRADLMALAMERRDLMPQDRTHTPWPILEGVKVCGWLHLHERAGMTWEDWRQAFIDQVASLMPRVAA